MKPLTLAHAPSVKGDSPAIEREFRHLVDTYNKSQVLTKSLTSSERTALTAEAGTIIFNSTTSRFEGYDGSAWKAFPVDVWNAKHYGAVGDGFVDDTKAIQQAIWAASAAGGGAVYLPRGTYRTTKTIYLPSLIQVFGDGDWCSAIKADGNFYILTLDPGTVSRVSRLYFYARDTQTSGGGIDYRDSSVVGDFSVDDCQWGPNLKIGLHIAPVSGTAGAFFVRRNRSRYMEGMTTWITVGDDTNFITSVFIENCYMTAATGGVGTWIDVRNSTDSVLVKNCGFNRGSKGVVFGNSLNSNNVSLMELIGTTVENCTSNGVQVHHTNNLKILGGGVNLNEIGILAQGAWKGLTIEGVTVQVNRADGIALQGSTGIVTHVRNCVISDNNTDDSANVNGISVGAGLTKFSITGNTVGNSLIQSGGHQKYGIIVATGASDDYIIAHNGCFGNETTDTVTDNGSGTNKVVADNI